MVDPSQAHAAGNAEQNTEVVMHNLNILIIDHLTKAGLNAAASTLHVSDNLG